MRTLLAGPASRGLALLAVLAVTTGWLTSRSEVLLEEARTPRAALHDMVDRLEALRKQGQARESTTLALRMRLQEPGRYLVPGDPDLAADLNRWPQVRRGSGEMPLLWDADAGRFVLLPIQFYNFTSEAQHRFTWFFLCAYSRLSGDLRRSGSTLAVGAAATVASEAVYPESWACLPVEVRDAATIFALLSLHAPGLLDACLSAKPADRKLLVRQAVDAMNRTERGTGVAGEATIDLNWLDSAPLTRGLAGRPVGVAQFLPRDPEALERLIDLVDEKLANLTIRARIIAAACPRFGGPNGPDQEKEKQKQEGKAKDGLLAKWRKRFDKLLVAAQEELTVRDREISQPQPRGCVIVPKFTAGAQRAICLRSDPALLEPLIAIAGRFCMARLREARKGGDKAFLDALKADERTSQVLQIAGVDPVIETRPQVVERGEPLLTRLSWTRLERHRGPDASMAKEEVVVELIDEQPAGQGQALGIGADNRVIVLDGPSRRKTRFASKVRRGDLVLGYILAGQPSRAQMFRLGADVNEAWFRVLDVSAATRTVVADLELGNGVRILFGEEHRILQALSGSGVWQKVGDLRPGSELWSKEPGPVGGTSLVGIAPLRRPESMIEFSLSWDQQRGRATNLVVFPPGKEDEEVGDIHALGQALLAEARSVDSGPLAPDQLVQTWSRQAGERVGVRADQLEISAARPSVLAGFFLQDKNGPWLEPPWLSEHRSRVLSRATVRVDEAVRLVFENGRDVVLAPENWVLGRGKHDLPVERPVNLLEPGEEIVRGVKGPELETIRLVKKDVVRPSGDASQYVLPRVENLPWVKVGPILVSVEAQARTDDEAAEGLTPDTTVAVRRPGGPFQYDRIAQLPESLDETSGRPVAAIDPRGPQLLPEPALVSGTRTRATTHTVTIRTTLAFDPGPGASAAERHPSLNCAPGQLLLVRRKGDANEPQNTSPVAISARALRPGDALIGFTDPKGGVSAWPVQRVIDQFHEPPLPILTVESRRRPRFFESGTIAILVNGGLGVVLGVPTGSEASTDLAAAAAAGPGEMSDVAPGRKVGRGVNAADPTKGLIAQLPPGATEDVIHFPPGALAGLRAFGPSLEAAFEGEAPRLRAPGRLGTPLLKYWEGKFAGRDRRWPYGLADVSTELRVWILDLVQRRGRFLNEPRSSDLPPILLQEMVLASWLRASGAVQLSERVLSDLLDLLVMAGCERDRERVRLGEHLGLPLVLYGTGFVRGEQPSKAFEQISLPAQQRLREWGGTELLVNGQLAMQSLYDTWVLKADQLGLRGETLPVPGYWKPIVPADDVTSLKGNALAVRDAFDRWVMWQVPALSGEVQVEGPSR